MTKIIAGMTMSLDGYINDEEDSGSARYSDFAEVVEDPRMQETIRTTGAVLMGRRTYDMAKNPEDWATYEFQIPLFIVTRNPPKERPPEAGGLSFTFVTDGIESAVAQAEAAAGGKDVQVVGGARTIQSLLKLGAVDELHIDVTPVLLKGGTRFFENLDEIQGSLTRVGVDELPGGLTGLRFRVNRYRKGVLL